MMDEVLYLPPLVVDGNYLSRWLFPIDGNNMVKVGLRVKKVPLLLGPALHYQPEGFLSPLPMFEIASLTALSWSAVMLNSISWPKQKSITPAW